MNIAVLPSCHRPPIARPSPSDRDIAKASLKFSRPPRAQIYRTAAGLPPQCHPPTSAATARWFGDVFAMPHLHIRHRRCQKHFKGVVKTCDAFLRCPNFSAPPQCHHSAAGMPPRDVCKCMQMRSPTHREGHRRKCDHRSGSIQCQMVFIFTFCGGYNSEPIQLVGTRVYLNNKFWST